MLAWRVADRQVPADTVAGAGFQSGATSPSGTGGTGTGSGSGGSGATPPPTTGRPCPAVALLELPDELRWERGDRMAEAILGANLASYDEQARGPDPLDNDQDWALVYALRSGLVP